MSAAQAEQAIEGGTERVPPSQMLRAHADMETGKDEPEPHQVAALVNCAVMSLGELRDVLIYSESPAVRGKAVAEFETRCRDVGYREATEAALAIIGGRRKKSL